MRGTREMRARIGPVMLDPADWRVLERTVATFGKSGHGREVFFAVVGSNSGRNVDADGLVILPLKSLTIPVDEHTSIINPEVMILLSPIRNLVAFGYVRTGNSIEPTEHDFTLSIMIDRKVGRPVNYIVMNPSFEYEVYRTPSSNLYGILQPVNEE